MPAIISTCTSPPSPVRNVALNVSVKGVSQGALKWMAFVITMTVWGVMLPRGRRSLILLLVMFSTQPFIRRLEPSGSPAKSRFLASAP